MTQDDIIEVKVDVGVLKSKVDTLSTLCDKIDLVIEKLVENQSRMADQIYTNMEKRKTETAAEIKDLNVRITENNRNLNDKLELTEHRIMAEIKSLKDAIATRETEKSKVVDKLVEWKWTLFGGIIVITWLLSNLKIDTILKLLH